ncbi:hypothetical protein G4B88_025211 [Cannabis sativa]|uniref:Reverse transcriptase zinc-binding domain-containing protein n=1 Tax=Cannabis sativa TaxID=3483 RepID=A0A7J6G228_CANSA|nr:hypothetical protein G4B88_025211 [Cannabis sativa]
MDEVLVKGIRAIPYYVMNCLQLSKNYKNKVRDCWQQTTTGTKMFQVVQKLKKLKGIFKKLRTKEQIQKFNPLVDETCLLCSNGSETLEHLFFTCHYSNMCVQSVKDWLEWKTSTNSLLQLAKWTDKSKLSATRKSIFHAALAAMAYHIWRVRNDALWNQKYLKCKCSNPYIDPIILFSPSLKAMK